MRQRGITREGKENAKSNKYFLSDVIFTHCPVNICWMEPFPHPCIPPQWDTTNWQLVGQSYSLYPVYNIYNMMMFVLQRGYYNARWYVWGKWSVRDTSTTPYNTQETLHDYIQQEMYNGNRIFHHQGSLQNDVRMYMLSTLLFISCRRWRCIGFPGTIISAKMSERCGQRCDQCQGRGQCVTVSPGQ